MSEKKVKKLKQEQEIRFELSDTYEGCKEQIISMLNIRNDMTIALNDLYNIIDGGLGSGITETEYRSIREQHSNLTALIQDIVITVSLTYPEIKDDQDIFGFVEVPIAFLKKEREEVLEAFQKLKEESMEGLEGAVYEGDESADDIVQDMIENAEQYIKEGEENRKKLEKQFKKKK